MRTRAAALATTLLLAAALAPTGQAASAVPDPGCEPSRPGVVYTASGVVSNPAGGRPVPCLVTIPRSSKAKETQLALTKAGTIVYQADLTLGDGQEEPPLQVAVSADKGRTWTGSGPEIGGEGIQNSGIDNHVYTDPVSGRVFWVVYGVQATAPRTTLGTSDDGGRTWKLGTMPCCNDAENPHLLAAKPRGSATTGYPNNLYWCTNTSVVGGIVFLIGVRVCFTSHDGGDTWDTGKILLNKQVGQYPDCAGKGEAYDALDGYYPTADAQGRLYLIVRCGPTLVNATGPTGPAFIIRSDDEMATWTKVSDAPDLPAGYGVFDPNAGAYKEEMRADRDGNLYLVRGTGAPTRALYLWVSRNGGRTWGPAQVISLPGTTSVQAPLWQLTVGAPGHLAVAYAGMQGSSPDLNAYLLETKNALAAKPVFRGAPLNDPEGDVHLVNQLAAYDYTDVEIGPDGVARAAYPFGLVGNLAATSAVPPARTSVTKPGTSMPGGALAATGGPTSLAAAALLLLAAAVLIRRRRPSAAST